MIKEPISAQNRLQNFPEEQSVNLQPTGFAKQAPKKEQSVISNPLLRVWTRMQMSMPTE